MRRKRTTDPAAPAAVDTDNLKIEVAVKVNGVDVAQDPVESPVVHFVKKGQVAAAKRGDEIKSLCGEATITGDPTHGAPICQKCVLAQLEVDDKKFDQRAQERYNAGVQAGETRGVAKGRADSMREIREAAEQRSRELQAAS